MIMCLLCGDPWKHCDFKKNYSWLMKPETRLFRSTSLKTGLITDNEEEELVAVEKKGLLAHNGKLLSLVRGGGEKTFHLLLETLTLMGEPFAEKCHELKRLLPQKGKRELHWPIIATKYVLSFCLAYGRNMWLIFC